MPSPPPCPVAGVDTAMKPMSNWATFLQTSNMKQPPRTLEFAYGDFCVGKMAEMLGKSQDAAYFYQSAYNYRNVFDPAVGFMRGRLTDGSWRPDFSPTEWGRPFHGRKFLALQLVCHAGPTGPDRTHGRRGGVLQLSWMNYFASPPDFEVGFLRT